MGISHNVYLNVVEDGNVKCKLVLKKRDKNAMQKKQNTQFTVKYFGLKVYNSREFGGVAIRSLV